VTLLSGETASRKTALVRELAALTGNDFVVIPCNQESDIADFIGQVTADHTRALASVSLRATAQWTAVSTDQAGRRSYLADAQRQLHALQKVVVVHIGPFLVNATKRREVFRALQKLSDEAAMPLPASAPRHAKLSAASKAWEDAALQVRCRAMPPPSLLIHCARPHSARLACWRAR
jgi:hypothetical protein